MMDIFFCSNLTQIRRVELCYTSWLLFLVTRCHCDNSPGGYPCLWEVVFFQTKLRPSPGCLRGPGILLMSIYIRMFRHYKIKYRSSKGIKIYISLYRNVSSTSCLPFGYPILTYKGTKIIIPTHKNNIYIRTITQ